MVHELPVKTIAIIGGGATGVSLLAQLLEAIETSRLSFKLRIVMFEKAKELGRGVAYGSTSESSILNMSASTMSPYPSDPEAFIRWLVDRGYISKHQAQHERSCVSLYPPRATFGEYLSTIADSLFIKAEHIGIECRRIKDEVEDVVPFGERHIVHARNAGRYVADWAVLCTGHLLSPSFPHLMRSDLFFNSPYPEEKLDGISPTALDIPKEPLSLTDEIVRCN